MRLCVEREGDRAKRENKGGGWSLRGRMFDQGKIAQWNDERGFGFISPDDGSPRVFAHILAFRSRHPLPEVGERVLYYLGPLSPKGPRASVVRYIDRVQRPAAWRGRHSALDVFAQKVAALVVVMVLVVLAVLWSQFEGESSHQREVNLPAPAKADPQFKCAGKTRCDQMASCAEAKYYLRHCPGVAIDGDDDGIPCEMTLCRGW